MTPELFQKIEEIFHRAAQLPVEERAAYLDRACSGDDELRQQVDAMLVSSSDFTDDPLSIPVAALIGQLLAAGASTEEVEDNIGWNEGDVILGLYEVVGLIGEGGMGKVYRVRHTGWNIELAMKVSRSGIFHTTTGKEGFIREAETWVGLGLHPHIVSCYYVRVLGDVPLVFAEYVGGGSLSDWIRSRRLYEGGPEESLKRILDIAIQFAWGLHYAHMRGLVHQDIKPANVMMTESGAAKVTDFGLSQARVSVGELALAADPEQSIVVPGVGLMTRAYCSPEQASGKPLSSKTDVWSWAVSVLEMFTGKIAWANGMKAHDALNEYLNQAREGERLAEMPDSVSSLLRHCFRDEPAKRPRDMMLIADRLQESYRELTGAAYPRQFPETARALADDLNNRAVSLLDLGKIEEAERLWEEALKVDPKHSESTYNSGLIKWRSGRLTDVELIRELEEVRGSHADRWRDAYLLALVHLERRDFATALEILEGIRQPENARPEVIGAMRIALENSVRVRGVERVFIGERDRWRLTVKTDDPFFPASFDDVNSVALSGDARYALSGAYSIPDRDNTLRLWDVQTGECLRVFNQTHVHSVALSLDGRLALSSGGGIGEHSIKLWDVETGDCLRTFEGHRGMVKAVSLSRDGRYALTGGSDASVRLWDVESGACLRIFDGHTSDVESVCFGPDAGYVLSGSRDTTAKLWPLVEGLKKYDFKGHLDEVKAVCSSSDGNFALSGSGNEILKLWDNSTDRFMETLGFHDWTVQSLSISRDGRYALSGAANVRLWEVATNRCLRTFEGHKRVKSVVFSEDGRLALSGGDHTIRLWDVDWSEVSTAQLEICRAVTSEALISHQSVFRSELDEARKTLAQDDVASAVRHLETARLQPGFARETKALKLWVGLYTRLPHRELRGSWEAATWKEHKKEVEAIRLSKDGQYALSGSKDYSLKLWKVSTGRCLRTYQGHKKTVLTVSLSSDMKHALSGSKDGTIKLWNVETGACLWTSEAHWNYVHSVCLSTDSRFAVSSGGDRTVKLWDVATGRCLRTLERHEARVHCVCLSPDGRYILSAGWDGTLRLWETSRGRLIRNFAGHEHDWLLSCCFSLDGRYALSGGRDKTLRLWEVKSGRSLRTFKGHTGWVNSVQLSHDGRYALSGSHDMTVKLWEVETGACLRTFEGHENYVRAISLSPDGSYALSASHDKTIKRWFLDWELEAHEPADWNRSARYYLQTFLRQQTPYASSLPADHEPPKREVALSLTRRGKPSWTDEDFQRLLYTLGCAGYGWLRPEGVRHQLKKMADKCDESS